MLRSDGAITNTHPAPVKVLSPSPASMAVLPSAERDTASAWKAPPKGFPPAPQPTSLVDCCAQNTPLLVQTHMAPALLLSPTPPTMAVLPSAARDTELP